MAQRRPHLFRFLEPAFFGGLLDDPLLYLRIRPLRRALLFDCGQLAHLAKRVVKAIDTVFVSHAHMDHLMGLPTLVRHQHAAPRPLDLYGPPGIAERVEHLLLGFDWNLSEPTWFTLRVHEIGPSQILHTSFVGPEQFARRFDGAEARQGREIWRCRYATVAAELLDHKLPVLAFRIEERPPFTIDPCRLEAQGLLPGEWIRDLKRRVWQGRWDAAPVLPTRARPSASEPAAQAPHDLYEAIRRHLPGAAIGYLCDAGWTPPNRDKIESLLPDLTLLCAEATFLAAEQDKARASHHLCTTDLNQLTARLRPRYLLPMHLSKSYQRRTSALYQELHPPPGTAILPLPNHLVPAPLQVGEVKEWLNLDKAFATETQRLGEYQIKILPN